MLDKNNIRELAYVVKIDKIEPIVGSDNCEAAVVGGWRVMVRKQTFHENDLAVYFEIDSKVDTNKPEFAFLEKRHGKIKTQKYTFGGKGKFISQGLLMSFSDFGWDKDKYAEGDFLTKELGVTYADADDNKRKAKSADKYKLMAQRRPNIFKKKWAQWFMRRKWGKKFMFLLFGKKQDNKSQWPAWVQKTDEERVQNMAWILENKTPWYATEKLDGSSTTFTMKGWGRKREFYICSRNVVFDKPDKKCFYDTNIYIEMAEKYYAEEVLAKLMEFFENTTNRDVEYVTIQGETFGEGVQKRDYGLKEHDFRAFNLIVGYKDGTKERMNPRKMTDILNMFEVPCVPIVDEHFILPNTVDELLAIATDASAIDGGMREGLVFRSADGVQSFKAVSNEFLIKFHS